MTGYEFDRLVRIKEVVKITGLSRSSIYLKLNALSRYWDPRFPKQIYISKRAVAWRLSQLIEWIKIGFIKK